MEKTIKFKKLNPDAVLPSYAHTYGDAGLDLFANQDEVIPPLERRLIKTGIASELPEKTVGLILGKSGLAYKHGILILGGVIDENYRGDIGVIMFNTDKEPYVVKKGEKVAQYVVLDVNYCRTTEIEELSDSSRGDGAFGSTGK